MFKTGDRVRVMAFTDLFMRGETHATVVAVGRKLVTVKGERSGRKFKFLLDTDCLEVV
jgi:hypothetical protein